MARPYFLCILLSAAAGAGSAQTPLLSRYCSGCHTGQTASGGLLIENLNPDAPSRNAADWERVIKKLSTRAMPPPGVPRPADADVRKFLATVSGSLDREAQVNPNPGRPSIHRLNRAEYSNAIRDLLALDIQAGSQLPVDDSGYGFDNIADVLSVSPSLLEKYLASARRVSQLAIGNVAQRPSEEEYTPRRDPPNGNRARLARNERAADDLPFDSQGGMSFTHYFPVDAEYLIRVKTPGFPIVEDDGPAYDTRLPVKAGMHRIGISFPRRSARPEIAEAPDYMASQGGRRPAPYSAILEVRLDEVLVNKFKFPYYQIKNMAGDSTLPKARSAVIGGPYNATDVGHTPSRSRIFVCHPGPSLTEAGCAAGILGNLGRRAFRRPVTNADMKPLLGIFAEAEKSGDSFEQAIGRALEAVLSSPEFLFRIEKDPPGKAGAAYRISNFELASRLSFFLWSSIPDDELLKLAEDGSLSNPQVLRNQVTRMMRDQRIDALVSNFAGQWLQLRNLSEVRPDDTVFPEFDESLRASFLSETELFFESVLRENRSILDLIGADYTYLNARLAEHYGVPGIQGSQLRRVNLTSPERGGLLGQGSILTVTSYPNRTTVVQRGKWVLENLLGSPPPPPPADVPALDEQTKSGKPLSLRQQMESHRANAICASCHSRMDPIGFALENFNGIGKWRTQDAGIEINATGKLPDGTTFSGPAELKNLILTSRRGEFLETIAEKFLVYAVGRGIEPSDMPAVRSIVRNAAAGNYTIPSFVQAIVSSAQFQMRARPTGANPAKSQKGDPSR